MTLASVRDAYEARAGEYVSLFGALPDPTLPETDFVRRHLGALDGPVLDVGCGPGQWSGYLHSLGVDVIGVDVVPSFVSAASAAYPSVPFRVASMTSLRGPVAGVLAWFSLIHLPPSAVAGRLALLASLLRPGGVLVLGFFDSPDEVAPFDHAITTAYRWPVAAMSSAMRGSGLTVVEDLRWQLSSRPDRRYATLAARVGAARL